MKKYSKQFLNKFMLNMKKNGARSFFFKIIQLLYSWRVIILRRKLNPGHYFTGVIFSLHRYRTPYFLCRSLTCPSYAVLVFTIRPSSWLHLLGDMKTIVFFVNGSKVRNSVQLLDTKFDEMIQNILHVKAIKKMFVSISCNYFMSVNVCDTISDVILSEIISQD